MNIFYLDENPKLSAIYHVDRHIVKMPTESAQLLCTAVNYHAKSQVAPYKSTHINHPSSIWTRSSIHNFEWLYGFMLQLNEEYKFRYNKKVDHLSITKLQESNILDLARSYFPKPTSNIPTPMVAVVPDDCKIGSTVECYREYYRKHKTELFAWTNREKPFWIDGD